MPILRSQLAHNPNEEDDITPETHPNNQSATDQANSLEQHASPLARATAVHMTLTTGIYDQIAELRRFSETLTNHLVNQDDRIKHDVKKFVENITPFDGQDPTQLISFIEEIQEIIDLKIASEPAIMSAIVDRLQGEFRKWCSEGIIVWKTWKRAKAELLKEFLSPLVKVQLINEHVRRFQRPQESFGDFIHDVVNKAESLEAVISEPDLILQLWSHVNYDTLLKIKDMQIPETIVELKKLVKRIRDSELLLQMAKSRENQVEARQSEVENSNTPRAMHCFYCKMAGHSMQNCRRRPTMQNSQASTRPAPKN